MHRRHTPITSQKQQGAMGVAYAVKKGDMPASSVGGVARTMARTMSKPMLKSHLQESTGKTLPRTAPTPRMKKGGYTTTVKAKGRGISW